MNHFPESVAAELDAMWRFALRLTSNTSDAEDLVQRTCVRALESEHLYKASGKLRSWLFQIEHRIWLNVLRSRRIRQTASFHGSAIAIEDASDQLQSDITTSSQDTPENTLRLQQVYEMVESLPEAQRHVVLLVCVEGFSYGETASILDIPIGTVMSRLARARITLGKSALRETGVVGDAALVSKKAGKKILATEQDGGVYS